MVTAFGHLRPREMDIGQPCAARVYDAFLEGNHNFGVEREFATRVEAKLPGITEVYRESRAFLHRTIECLIDRGIHQFLDLGSGIPTIGSVHEVARRRTDQFRVLYVENEPLTVAHSQTLLTDEPRARIINADVRQLDAVIGAPEVQNWLDFEQPVALVMSSLLHFIPDDDDPWSLVRQYEHILVPGSYLVLSHVTASDDPASATRLCELYDETTDPLLARDVIRIESLFDGFEALSPGLVYLADWRPDPQGPHALARYRVLYGGVGRKPDQLNVE